MLTSVLDMPDFTTQEFFDRFRDTYFPEAEQQMTITTLAYLSRPGDIQLEDFDYGWTISFKRMDWKNKYPFYDYSVLNWGVHGNECHSTANESVISFLIQDYDVIFPCLNHLCEVVELCRNLEIKTMIENNPRHVGVYLAIYHGQLHALEFFLSKHLQYVCHPHEKNPFIFWASILNQVEALKILLAFCLTPPTESICLQKGAVIAGLNAKFEGSYTPLAWVCNEGHQSIVELLLRQPGVLVDLGDPLLHASRNGHESIVKSLLAHPDVDPNWKGDGSWTALAFAAYWEQSAIVKLLLGCPFIQADEKTSYGQTPLSLACEVGCESAVKLLLTHPGVDINTRDVDGHTPLWWAKKEKNASILRLLLEYHDGAHE
jgi:hypothetical protein